jgi:N-acetylmuramoyl-L-alanine amidase
MARMSGYGTVLKAAARAAGAVAVLVCAAATPAWAKSAVATDVRVGQFEGATRFVLSVDRNIPFEVFVLGDPFRVVVDVPEIGWSLPPTPLPGPSGLFKRLRYGLFKPGQSRIVLDLNAPFEIDRAFKLRPNGDLGHRLVVDLRPASAQAFRAAVARAPMAVGETAFAAEAAPAPAPTPQAASAAVTQPPSAAQPAAESVQAAFTLPPAPRKPRSSRAKMTVVLDAGHGGVDPGAIGRSGTYEKTITLAMARDLRDVLEATGRYRVVLTRDRDIFIRLRDRVALARKAGADLFISLHADSIKNRKISGPSVYTLSEKASDKEAAALAEKENKADLLAGVDLTDAPPDVANILLDLTQRETMNQSARFATGMIGEISKVAKPLRNTHRFAGFAVLKAHDVPSVLIEMGFLSSKKDEERLTSRRYRRTLADAIRRSVDAYFTQVQQANRP